MPIRFNTCLLIDDNFIDNFVTRKILETANFADNIIVIQSAQDAINALRDGSVKPDAIFLDIRMPMMSGFEFLQEYEALDLDNKDVVKIFMLSSSLNPTDMNNSKSNKYVAQFVHKPLTLQALEELIT
ncbi:MULTISPECIES: response regulator [unclassified Mucilaginibacter]|uniref:response regulator n=1 Tax=unclassified Mucilaginibacter TaxID=2617802 RepID=UPI002AC98C4D|nr:MULTISPECIES: response regulator [unclassified Mucilaginibacter]MEB0261627.1 response regulator [Mucilaginibacter sp. 10I4]MEB0278491.1 response regulator [Mucilaginibacter sp. 10B2]MEB0300711.1 response regulator [Mucilaginibacter sp. 5C4]WPX23552.1 response regulator [Mucilaginibacter sp. 5C4]